MQIFASDWLSQAGQKLLVISQLPHTHRGVHDCPRDSHNVPCHRCFFPLVQSPTPSVHDPPPPPSEILRELYGQEEYGEQEFSLDELRSATGNFSPQLLLGEGGAGQVYRGRIRKAERDARLRDLSFHGQGRAGELVSEGNRGSRDGDSQEFADIAVKRLKWWGPALAQEAGEMNAKQFLTELRVIRRIRHPNLLSLLGVCATAGELLMVFDLMPNGSLDQRLRSEWRKEHTLSGCLSWPEESE